MRLSAIYAALLVGFAAVHALPAVEVRCVSCTHTTYILSLIYMIKDVYLFAEERGVGAEMQKRNCVRISSFVTSFLWLICLKFRRLVKDRSRANTWEELFDI